MKTKLKLAVPMSVAERYKTELQSIKLPFYASKILIVRRAYEALVKRQSNSNEKIEQVVNSISKFTNREPAVVDEYLTHSEYIGIDTLKHFETLNISRRFFTEAQRTKRCLVKNLRAAGLSDERLLPIVSKEIAALLPEYETTGRVNFNKAVGDRYVKGEHMAMKANAVAVTTLPPVKPFGYQPPPPQKNFNMKLGQKKLQKIFSTTGERLQDLGAYQRLFPQKSLKELKNIINELSITFSILNFQNAKRNSTQKTRRAA
jgi:hypothetical protein